MKHFVIDGPARLSGTVAISGSKNAVLPCLAAGLLADTPSRLTNVPDINDVRTLAEIIGGLGSAITRENDTLTIDPRGLKNGSFDPALFGQIRASLLLIGPLLARFGKVTLPRSGGDKIGARPISTHLSALTDMGCAVSEEGGLYTISGRPRAGRVILPELSVTATEVALMAAVTAEGTTTIHLAATEPHVTGLAQYLAAMGASIEGIGTHTLTVTGVSSLRGAEYRIIPDQIDAGTFAIAAAASRGDVTITDFVVADNLLLLKMLRQAGAVVHELAPNRIRVKGAEHYRPLRVRTDTDPGFPSDLQAPMAVLLTQADGTSEIFETLYEGRLNYLYELQKMGAHAEIHDSHVARISGPTELHGVEIQSFDLRAGATLILAATVAHGTTTIHNIEHIDRGYERIDEKLRALGLSIKRVEA